MFQVSMGFLVKQTISFRLIRALVLFGLFYKE